MTMMKTTLTKLLSLMSLLCAATNAHAATLTISGGDGNPAITRFAPFGATLTATVTEPPIETEEVTITGPVYYWNGGGSGLSFPAPESHDASVSLSSAASPNYGGGGQKNVSVSCTAVFTSTDKKTGNKTYIPVSNSKTVRFFVRIPERIATQSVEASRYHGIYGSLFDYGISPYNGFYVMPPEGSPFIWGTPFGSSDDWHLSVQDNRGDVYENGEIYGQKEGKSEESYTRGTYQGNALDQGEFIDRISRIWVNDPLLLKSAILYDGNQSWRLTEELTTSYLNTQHIVDWYGAPDTPGTITSSRTG